MKNPHLTLCGEGAGFHSNACHAILQEKFHNLPQSVRNTARQKVSTNERSRERAPAPAPAYHLASHERVQQFIQIFAGANRRSDLTDADVIVAEEHGEQSRVNGMGRKRIQRGRLEIPAHYDL